MSLWTTSVALVVPVVLGAGATAARLFRDVDSAIDDLNAFSLYIAFPPLVIAGLLQPGFVIPTNPGFWLIVPIALAVTCVAARLIVPAQSPTIALILAFGNVAYLGLPVVESVLGPRALGVASLAVSIHVTLALTVGPVLLLRWSGANSDSRAVLARVARQPLLWAPLIGLLARLLPASAQAILREVLTPLGRCAAPVALFLLGMYLFANRTKVRRADAGDLWHLAFKLVLLPILTFALVLAAQRYAGLRALEGHVLILFAAMPAAITTFSMARDLRVGTERVSRAVVASAIASGLTVPIAAWAALRYVVDR